MASHPPPDPTYTVFVRLPFPRGDFVDPPPANWESSKDEALWSIVSKLSKTEIDWNEIASKFEVTVDFLLQQVAWLTERHASQVRAQMRKAAAAAKISPAPSPQPQGPDGGFSTDPPRLAGLARAPSSTSLRRDSPLPRNEQSVPSSSLRSTPRPLPTRTSSSNTTFSTTRNIGSGVKGTGKSSADGQRHRLTSLPIATNVNYDDQYNPEAGLQGLQSPGPAESSSDSSSSSSSPAQSRIIRRPPRFQSNEGPAFGDEDDDDAEPAFAPYRPPTSEQADMSATLRGDHKEHTKRPPKGPSRDRLFHSQTSDSSTGSAPTSGGAHDRRPGGPSQPHQMTARSPLHKGKGYSRDSDGTPSMSSSFSDLDDASVTQSALEDMLASRMRDGGTISSLRGTISNVFSRRNQPKPNNAP